MTPAIGLRLVSMPRRGRDGMVADECSHLIQGAEQRLEIFRPDGDVELAEGAVALRHTFHEPQTWIAVGGPPKL